MDSDGPPTVVLTVADAAWREAIDHLEERCQRFVAVTLRQATEVTWLRRGEVSVLLSNDDGIRELNDRYRGHDRATNVLSFPNFDLDHGEAQSAMPPAGPVLLGDIAMSLQRLSHEARELKKPILDHFAHLLVHGTLHLLGYDHQKDHQAEAMEGLEKSVLLNIGMAAPYDARAETDASGALP